MFEDENPCLMCDYRDECEFCDCYNFCENCKHYYDCSLKYVYCKANHQIECNNGFESKWDDDLPWDEDEE